METTSFKHKSFIGMKDVDGNYIIAQLNADMGRNHTLQVLSTELEYSSVKNMLKFDYKHITSTNDIISGKNKYNTLTRLTKGIRIYTAKEMDDMFDDCYKHHNFTTAYIFYPKERLWRVYELPNQNQILQAP